MALTTSGELQKQLTVIFGFQGYLDLKVGEIVGIGKLSQKNTRNLINQVLNYLYAYNSMLEEFAGCKLYSIEFELNSFDHQKDMKILPKSMLFIPGVYKNVNTLMLLLAPEMSLLDNQKAKKSIHEIGKKIFEVEEALNRDQLTETNKLTLLSKFAERFALKLQGEVIEGKWKKKLVGLKSKIQDQNYLSINLKQQLNWQLKKYLIKKFSYREEKLNFDDFELEFNFLQYKIHPEIINSIIYNTFDLTANLMHIANTGTINDSQNQILTIFLNIFKQYMNNLAEKWTIQEFKENLEQFIPKLNKFLLKYNEICENFTKKVFETKNIKEMTNKFLLSFNLKDGDVLQTKFLYGMGQVTKFHLINHKYRYDLQNKIRSNELATAFLYIKQSSEFVLSAIKKSLPHYFQLFLMESLLVNLVESVKHEFDKRKEYSIQILGSKSINTLTQFYQVLIESYCIEYKLRDPQQILHIFPDIIQNNMESFLEEIKFNIEDVLEFCRSNLPSIPLFEKTIERLMLFRTRIENFWNLVLHQSTKKRLLYIINDLEYNDPNTISNAAINFLQKKFGGIQSYWKKYFFDYFKDFSTKYQEKFLEDSANGKMWSKIKTYKLLFDYIETRIKEDVKIEGFLEPLKKDLNQEVMYSIEKKPLLEIQKIYLQGIDLIEQFPEYLHQIIIKCLQSLDFSYIQYPITFYLKSLPSIRDIINIKQTQTTLPDFSISSYYDYIINSEMKYFSKLIAKPSQIILKSINKNDKIGKKIEYRLNFHEISDKYLRINISTNFPTNFKNFKNGGIS